jgi:Flp pilus assembly protein TadG
MIRTGKHSHSLLHDSRGQALVEFSLAVTVFLLLLMGVADFGMAIYKYNGVSEAASEIARVTSVHPGTNPTVHWSSQMAAVVSTQQSLVPGLSNPTISCFLIDGVTSASCTSGNYVRVTVTAPYKAVTPLLGLLGTWTMKGTSSVQIAP